MENRYDRLKEMKQSKVSHSEYVQTDHLASPLAIHDEEKESKKGLKDTAPTPLYTPAKK